MTDERIFEENLQSDLKRWAEAGAPSFDLGGALAQRTRLKRNRWRRWGSVAATVLILSTAATVTFSAWADAASHWPIIGEPIKAFLAERAGLSWAYEMGFYQANLGELSEGGVTLRVLGVIADPIQTKVFYQVQGVEPNQKPIRPGEEEPKRPFELGIEPMNNEFNVVAYYAISGEQTADVYYVAETTPIQGESATLRLRLRVGESEKRVEIPVSLADSSRHFEQIAVDQTQTHDPLSITLQSLTLSPVEVVATYKTETPSTPKGSWSRGPLPQPYLRSNGREIPGRPIASFGINGVSHLGFERVSGKAQLVIPALSAPVPVDAQWAWAPGSTAIVEGVPVTLKSIQPTMPRGESVHLTFPADSKLLGFGGIALIGADGTRLEQTSMGGGGGDGPIANAHIFVEYPAGFKPAALEISHAVMRIDGPWVFDLPPLPDKP